VYDICADVGKVVEPDGHVVSVEVVYVYEHSGGMVGTSHTHNMAIIVSEDTDITLICVAYHPDLEGVMRLVDVRTWVHTFPDHVYITQVVG
jgi:hypothetical protein